MFWAVKFEMKAATRATAVPGEGQAATTGDSNVLLPSDCDGDGDDEGVTVGVGDGDAVREGDGVPLALQSGDKVEETVASGVGVPVGLEDPVCVCDGVSDRVIVCDCVDVCVCVGVCVTDSVSIDVAVELSNPEAVEVALTDWVAQARLVSLPLCSADTDCESTVVDVSSNDTLATAEREARAVADPLPEKEAPALAL